MKLNVKHTSIVILLMVIVCVLNVQFYFEKNISTLNPHHSTTLKAASEKITINPFTDLIEEDEDGNETKALLHITFLSSLVFLITIHIVSVFNKPQFRNSIYTLAGSTPLYVRYCTLLI